MESNSGFKIGGWLRGGGANHATINSKLVGSEPWVLHGKPWLRVKPAWCHFKQTLHVGKPQLKLTSSGSGILLLQQQCICGRCIQTDAYRRWGEGGGRQPCITNSSYMVWQVRHNRPTTEDAWKNNSLQWQMYSLLRCGLGVAAQSVRLHPCDPAHLLSRRPRPLHLVRVHLSHHSEHGTNWNIGSRLWKSPLTGVSNRRDEVQWASAFFPISTKLHPLFKEEKKQNV